MRDIYVLVDESRTIRYVGSTKYVDRRLKEHWRHRHMLKRPVNQWLATLESPPELVVLQSVTDDAAAAAERYWIELLRQVPSVDLLNRRATSSGSAPWTAARRERASRAQMGRRKGLKASVETRERMRQAHLGSQFSDERREKIREAAKKRWAKRSPEERSEIALKMWETRRRNAGGDTHD